MRLLIAVCLLSGFAAGATAAEVKGTSRIDAAVSYTHLTLPTTPYV